MNPTDITHHPSLAILLIMCIYAGSWTFSSVLLRFECFKTSITSRSTRYGSLDGLRGILALSVMAFHSVVTYVFFTTGKMDTTVSPILNHLGESSVALFFMITAFLFTNKAFQPQVRWKALYLSRIYRLTPLYLVIVLVLFGLVFWLSDFHLKEPPIEVLKEFFLWLTFCCFGRPDINGYPKTWVLIAGVNWTLRLEILFYLVAVPLLHLMSRIASIQTALLTMICVVVAILGYRYYKGPVSVWFWLLTLYAAHFAGGIIVALAMRIPRLKTWIESRIFHILAIVAFVPFFILPHSDNIASVLCTILIFAAVTGGASLFGILNTPNAIWLGDISYGIYLIHGMCLWLTMFFLNHCEVLEHMTLLPFLLTVVTVASLVVALSSVSYTWLEKPIMGRLSSKRGAPTA